MGILAYCLRMELLALLVVAFVVATYASEVSAPVRVKKAVAALSASTELAADALTIITSPKEACDASQNMAVASWAAMEPKPQILLVGATKTQCIDTLVSKHGAQFVKTETTTVPEIIKAGEQVAENDVVTFINSDVVMPNDFAAKALHATKSNYRQHQFVDPLQRSEMFKPPVLVGSRADCAVTAVTEMSHSMLRTQGNCYHGSCNGADYFVFVKGFMGAIETPAFTHGQKHWDSFFMVAGQHFGHLIDLSPVVDALRIAQKHIELSNAAETRMCPSGFVTRDTDAWSHNYCLRMSSDTVSSYDKKCQKLTQNALQQGIVDAAKIAHLGYLAQSQPAFWGCPCSDAACTDAAQNMKNKVDALNAHWTLVTHIVRRNVQKTDAMDKPAMRRYSSDSSSSSASDSSSASSSASSSDSSSGSDSPTPTPATPAPTNAATSGKTIVQAVTFDIDVSAYTGNTKTLYERSYAAVLGIYTASTNTWTTGCSVDSSAVAARRAAVVTFTATTTASAAANAESAASSMDASTLTTSITNTKNTLGGDFASISTPTVQNVATPTTTTIVSGAWQGATTSIVTVAMCMVAMLFRH